MYIYLTIQSRHWGIWGFKKEILSKDANPFKDYECVNFIFQKLKWMFPLKNSLPKMAPKRRFLAPKKKLLTKSNSEAFAANRNAVVREVLRAKAWEGLKSKEGLRWSVFFVDQRLIDDDILYDLFDYMCDNCDEWIWWLWHIYEIIWIWWWSIWWCGVVLKAPALQPTCDKKDIFVNIEVISIPYRIGHVFLKCFSSYVTMFPLSGVKPEKILS